LHIKLFKLILSILIVSLIWSVDKVTYAGQGNVHPGESVWPDEWEKEVLKKLALTEPSRDIGFGEILEIDDKKIYRYMKPIYVERACLECHGVKENILPAIRQFLEKRYPHDQAYDYKEGDFRGGISITISLERLGF
jgi:hypothetical protein